MNDIVISHLFKRFGNKTVLNDLNAVFRADEITCIMGASGCGKTTLLNILMGFLKADSGRVEGMPEGVSAVFQEDRLSETLTARANIRMVTGRRVHDEAIAACFRSLGLDASLNETVSALSGGQKRRVAIARALLAESDLLILDEPFKGLDAANRQQVADILRASGKTILMVTHDPEEARMMDARVFHME